MFLLVATLVGCSARTPIEAPRLAETPLPPADPLPYRLQPGDLIAVKFWGSAELDEEQRIRPDGQISMPFVDEVRAAGLTPEELDAELTERYSTELHHPRLTVIVREASQSRVFIGGEVKTQGVYQLIGRVTMLQAIQQAGGFLTTARLREVLLIRDLAEGRIARSVDLRPVMSGADLTADLQLQPGDVLFVPRSRIESLNLFIDSYIDDVVPLQNVFSGYLLGDLTDDDGETTVIAPQTPTPPEGGTP